MSTSILVLGGFVGTAITAPAGNHARQLINGPVQLQCLTPELEYTCVVNFDTYCDRHGGFHTGYTAMCGSNRSCWCETINQHCGYHCAAETGDVKQEGDEVAKAEDMHMDKSDESAPE